MNGLLKKALTVVLSTTMLTSTIPSGNVSTVVAQGYDIPETYGYVEHSYNPRNLWARLGNLFIGIGPIFSGLGVVVLLLWLCFPNVPLY